MVPAGEPQWDLAALESDDGSTKGDQWRDASFELVCDHSSISADSGDAGKRRGPSQPDSQRPPSPRRGRGRGRQSQRGRPKGSRHLRALLREMQEEADQDAAAAVELPAAAEAAIEPSHKQANAQLAREARLKRKSECLALGRHAVPP